MKKNLSLALLIIPMSISMAFAEDTSSTVTNNETQFSFSGFGTFGYVGTNTNDAEFARQGQARGATKTFKNGVDSNLGLQGIMKVNDKLSFTGQALIRKNIKDDFDAELAWAFGKYNFTNDLSVKVGRMGLPVYMISDYRNVGYANTMMRPSNEVYSLMPIISYDGADLTYTKNIGDVNLTTQLGAGKASTDSPGLGSIKINDILFLNMTAEYGPLTVRAGRATGNVSLDNSPTITGLLNTLSGVGFSNLSKDLALTNKKGTFTSLGATLDWKNVLVQTEYANRQSDSFMGETKSWYVMGGYRMGNVLPYVAHASIKQASARTTNAIPNVGPYVPLVAGVNTLLTQSEQTSNTIGVRWDFAKNTALKFQIDRISPINGKGLFINAKPGFSQPVTVVGAAIDFVF